MLLGAPNGKTVMMQHLEPLKSLQAQVEGLGIKLLEKREL
jgi:hypothetical protein